MRCLVLLFCGLLGGCSLFMERAPKKDPGTRPVACTESMVPPIADMVVAGGLVVIGIASVAAKDDSVSTTTLVVAEVLLLGAVAVLGYSAFVGYTSVKRCRAYNAQPPTPRQPAGREDL